MTQDENLSANVFLKLVFVIVDDDIPVLLCEGGHCGESQVGNPLAPDRIQVTLV